MSKRRQRERQEQERRRQEEARRQRGTAQQIQPPREPSLEELERRVEGLGAPPSLNGAAAPIPAVAPSDTDLPRLRECYQRMEAMRVQYEQALKEIGDQKSALDGQAKAHDARGAELETARAEVARHSKKCEDERATLELLSLELDERSRTIEAREKDADAGFIERSKKALERQTEQEEVSRKRLGVLKEQIADGEKRLAAQAETQRQKLQGELAVLEQEARARIAEEEQKLGQQAAASRAALEVEVQKLETQRQDLREHQRRLDLDARLLEDKRREIDQTAH